MANFDDQVRGLTSLTISSSGTSPTEAELTQFLTDGAKEIINILPPKLKEKCMKITNLYIGNTNTTFDLDDAGEVTYVTRENANSGYFTSCRKIPAIHGDLTNDSGNIIHYATATDPVYYIESNSLGVATLFVKPTPTSLQPAKVYHISYPTVAYNAGGTIANFPNEAEYIVVLYAACKALQSAMGAMQASIVHSDQDGSYTAPTSLDVSGGTGSQGWEQVRFWLETEEDTEMSGATMSSLSGELQQFVTEYQWYQGQYKMLKQDYTAGISSLSMAKGQMAVIETK